MTTPPPQEEPTANATDTSVDAFEAVRKSEERFRLAARAGKMYAYEWDALTGVGVLSGECAPVLGVNEGTQLTHEQFLSKVHPDDRERLMTAFNGLTSGNPSLQVSYRIMHPDRGVIWVEANSIAFFDEAGRMLRIIGMGVDITARKLAEIELAMANDRLQLSLQAGKSVGWEWDVKSGRVSRFGELQTKLGTPSGSSIEHIEDFRRRVYPEDRERVWKAVQDAMETRKPYAVEFRLLWPDGTVRWVTAQGKLYYSPDGEPERMLGVTIDITDRKAAEETLHRRDLELEEAQRIAGVGSWLWRPETDTVLWSDELYRIAGRDRNLPAVSYREHSQLYTAESWERLKRAVEEALSTGAPYELELEMIRPDGTRRWLVARGETQRDSAGHMVQLRGTVQDITERKRSEQELRESEERLRLAAHARRMYAWDWEKASDVIVISAEFTRILGLPSEQQNTTYQQLLTIVHPDDRAKLVLATNGCTPENPTFRVVYRVLRPDGSAVWLEKNGHALFDGKGNMLRMIGMVTDITQQKLAEEALSALNRRLIEAQETERARIARDLHDDIGQRLALVSVMLSQMKRNAPKSQNDVRSRVDQVREQIVEISASVHAMSHDLHSSTLLHLGLASAAEGFCMELSQQNKVKIDFLCKDIPSMVPQDVSLCLFRVLQEALHNAVKYSGVSRFEVELRGTSDALHLKVSDSGIGFDPDAAIKRGGLGLTSMRERLNLVNGELSIDSEPGVGTTIHAKVPLGLRSASARAGG